MNQPVFREIDSLTFYLEDTGSPMTKCNKVNQYLNKFSWILELVIATALINMLKVILSFLDFRDLQFTAVNNYILFSSSSVLLGNLNLRGFRFPVLGGSPHINSVNREMPVTNFVIHKDFFKYVLVYFMTLCHGWPCTTYLLHSNWWSWLQLCTVLSLIWQLSAKLPPSCR